MPMVVSFFASRNCPKPDINSKTNTMLGLSSKEFANSKIYRLHCAELSNLCLKCDFYFLHRKNKSAIYCTVGHTLSLLLIENGHFSDNLSVISSIGRGLGPLGLIATGRSQSTFNRWLEFVRPSSP